MTHYDLLSPDYPPLTLCRQCKAYELCDGFGRDITTRHRFSCCKENKVIVYG